MALAIPTVPTLTALPGVATSWHGFPVTLELSGPALTVILVLVAIFFAIVSVVMVYHWRRFPYEQEVFDRVERLYFFVSFILLAVSVGALFVTL